MWFSRLRIERLRNLAAVELESGPGLVVLQGPNGAGKSSVLEGMCLLGRGRSFRSGQAGSLIQRGAESLSVFAEISGADARASRVGYSRSHRSWTARCNGSSVESLAVLARSCPVVCFEPGSHEWVSGAAESRRRLLDWVVFHVEHGFQREWLRYRHALAARNQLLRIGGSDSEYGAWEAVLRDSGSTIQQMRSRIAEKFCEQVQAWWARLTREQVKLAVTLHPGWDIETDLGSMLFQNRSRDRELGYTRRGPHRADLQLQADDRAARDVVSRGQQKALALCLLLAQIDCVAAQGGVYPILLLDDFPSELDLEVQQRVLSSVVTVGRQVWLTGTSFDLQTLDIAGSANMFHVEQGQLRQLV